MNGVEMIAAERRRQVEYEGWTANHDDAAHGDGELADAAAELIVDGLDYWDHDPLDMCGSLAKFGREGSKPDPVRCLVIAGALIAAEIDRLVEAPAQCIQGCHLDRPTGVMHHSPGCPNLVEAPEKHGDWLMHEARLIRRLQPLWNFKPKGGR